MPLRTALQRRRSTPRTFVVVQRPGPAMLAGITQAAALMARADGRVDNSERDALLRFLRGRDLLPLVGRRAALCAFHAELARGRPDEETLEAIGRQRGTQGALPVATAASQIARADQHLDPRELDLLRRMHERLGLAGAGQAQGVRA
jgi:tellurite resistance protein